jgi:hypothetical protein
MIQIKQICNVELGGEGGWWQAGVGVETSNGAIIGVRSEDVSRAQGLTFNPHGEALGGRHLINHRG